MAKQLNKVEVNLEISASTEKAKKAFMDLNKSLSDLQNQNLINPDNGIRQAAQDARELQEHLSKAVNVDTGRLDLNRFSNSLKSSKKELKDYYNSLMKLGDQGEKAFMQLSRSIATAETSTVRVNKKMQEFATTLKNAARWQISSSILHGLMGAVQGAYGYAKDLDSALNDIRIVTGLSADEMDKFAVKANHAAKALSTTTTEYAKASLIYFQQGLSDSQVEERTAITMKMANAAGASAETISDQLTAVWNNFYDGSQSLEHFADAMVRLGADTASSSDEIATGLEKFASIGQVIGLGFDEAASALATVTAQTRQSAEVVGTAFKTIFARIQGLNLGETLEDGTTLNKYSEALAKVGISIKNEYGGIKDMNTLLDEMGEKWNLISKDQQIALAQAVGGVRQYNQIVALMDNYDFYQQNLNAARGADGSLEEQAAVYAESWEASEDRVRAAAEGVYDSLINEDFFIEFNNNLSTLLEGVEGLIDGFGGMEGVLSMIGSLALRYFAKDIPSALSNTKDNIVGLLGLDSKGAKKVQKDNDKLTDSDYLDNADPYKKVRVAQIEGTKTLNTMNQQLNANLKNLSAEEKAIYETKIKQVEKDYELLELQGRELEQEEKTTKELQNQIAAKMAKKKVEEENNDDEKIREEAFSQAERELASKKPSPRNEKKLAAYEKKLNTRAEEIYEQNKKEINTSSSNRKRVRSKTDNNKEKLNELKQLVVQQEKLLRVEEEIDKLKKGKKDTQEYAQSSKNIQMIVNRLKDVDKKSDAFKNLNNVLNDTEATAEEIEKAFQDFLVEEGKTVDNYDDKIEDLEKDLKNLGLDNTDLDDLKTQFQRGVLAGVEFDASLEEIGEEAEDLPKHTVKTSEAIAELTSGIMGLVGMTSSIENLFDTFNDEDASAIQKISAAMGGLMSAGTAVSGMYRGLKSVSESTFVQKIKEASAIKASATATTADAAAKVGLAGATKTATVATNGFSAALKSIPVLGWIAAGITLLTGIITGFAAAAEKAKEKRVELAKESKEIADATYEEVEANKELRKSFDDALASYKEGKIEKNELVAATEELCNKYKIENAELLIAADNYDLLAEAIRRAENEKLKAAKKKTSDAKEAAEDVFLDTMYEGVGHHGIGDKYVANLQGSVATNFRADDEKIVKDAVEQLYSNKEISDSIKFGSHGIVMETGQSAEELIKLYEDAQKVKEYILSNTDAEARNESEGYQNLVSWLNKSAESYENLIALQEQLNSESVQLQTNNIISKYGEIESQEEYLKAEAELAEKLYQSENIPLDEAKELARQALMTENAYAEMAKSAEIIDQAAEATGGNISKETLQEKYNTLSDEEKTLFASIGFDTIKNEEELDKQLDALKARAEEYSSQVKIDTIQQAQDNLKSNMTLDDYKDFEKSSGIDWGNEEEGIISYSNFLLLTFEEQTNYLDELEKKYVENSKSTIEAAKLANEELIKDLENKKVEANKFNVGGQQSDNFTLEDFEKTYIGDSTYNQDFLLKLKTLNPEDEEYGMAKKALARTIGVTEADLENYISKWKEVQNLQASINNLQKQNDDYDQTDEVNNALELKQQYEDAVNLSKTLAELEVGDTINYEEFTKLGEYLPSLTTNFERTADGSYKLKEGFDNIYVSLSALKNDLGEDIFTDFEIAEMIPDLETLRDTFEKDAISAEAFSTRWAELNEVADLEGLDTDELKDYSKHLQDVADDSEILSKELKDNDKAAKIVAKSIMKMNKGVDALAGGFEDWSDIIKNSTKESEEYNEATDDMRSALSDVLDVSEDFVSNDFLEEHLVDIEKAATGDAEAIDRLKAALATDIIKKIVLDNEITDEKSKEIIAAAEALQASIPDIKVGATIDTTKMAEDEKAFLEQCQKIITDANMTAEQANAYFDAMGFETTFVTEQQPVTKKGRGTVTVTEKFPETTYENPDGSTYTIPGGWQTKTYPGEEYEYTDFVDTIAMATSPDGKEVPKIDTITKKATGAQNNFSADNAGGGSPGGSKKSSTKNTGPKKSVKPERYKEINDKIDDVSNAYEKANKEADRLYGPARIAKLKEANSILEKEIKLQEKREKQVKKYLNDDKKALELAGQDLGITVSINDDNLITNYTYIMEKADKALQDAYASVGDTIEEGEEKFLEEVEKKVDTFTEAIKQFDETREELQEQQNKIKEERDEWQDNNFNQLNEELELKIEIDDRALDRLEYYADKFSDNFYKLAETYALIIKGVNDEGIGKIDLAKDKLAQYAGPIGEDGKVSDGGYRQELEDQLLAGKISPEQYIEGLKNVETNVRDALTELNGYDKEMLEAYGNALDAASSKIDDHVDHLEHISSVFDHYLSLMDLFGNAKDYEAMGNFLTGKAENSRNMLDIAKAELEMYREQKAEIEKDWIKAQQSGDEEAIRYWQTQWDAIVDQTDAAEEEMLSLTETWAQDMRAVVENNMTAAAEALEKSLTNGHGFEYLMDQWDKMNTRQEEYLDNVNKTYETNKLMRTAQKALDETDNKVAKQKLKGFIDETQHLQENTNLSKHELEIQQAKYDLLLAEIALEEAQNAKSVVRLSRDNEGNFGYVYTADQDKVADAQQGVDDKRNDLYNLTLEGQKEYMEKYLQASQEMYDELNALQEDYLNGVITKDEFESRKANLEEYYLGNVKFREELSDLETKWQNGEIESREAYEKMRQDVINKYEAEDIGIINQYLDLANIANTKANEELEKLDNQFYKDGTISEEEYQKKKNELMSTYADTNEGVVGNFLDFYNRKTGETTDEASEKWGTNLGDMVDDSSKWEEDVNKYVDAVESNTEDWGRTEAEVNKDVGKALTDSATASDNLRKESEKLTTTLIGSNGLADAEDSVLGKMELELTAVRELTTEYGGLNEAYQSQRSELLLLTAAYEEYLTTLGKKIDAESGKEEKPAETPPPATDDTNSKKNGGQITSYNNDNSSAIAKKKSDALDLLDKAWRPGLGTDSRGWKKAAESGDYGVWGQSVINLVYDALSYSKYKDNNGNSNYDYEKAKNYINSYDTGGYTGIWGPEGKLAFLHEKEIVLNKDDTENLLKTVSFIRELVSIIDSQASMSSLFNMTATTGIMTGNAGMEQQITIYADFPDATDHNEIEMAFNTLLNTASQYANRK